MIDYLFPIFGFGVVVTGIVVKGLLTAREIHQAQSSSQLPPGVSLHTNRPNEIPGEAFSQLSPNANI